MSTIINGLNWCRSNGTNTPRTFECGRTLRQSQLPA
jgi:hypothetical protein